MGLSARRSSSTAFVDGLLKRKSDSDTDLKRSFVMFTFTSYEKQALSSHDVLLSERGTNGL